MQHFILPPFASYHRLIARIDSTYYDWPDMDQLLDVLFCVAMDPTTDSLDQLIEYVLEDIQDEPAEDSVKLTEADITDIDYQLRETVFEIHDFLRGEGLLWVEKEPYWKAEDHYYRIVLSVGGRMGNAA